MKIYLPYKLQVVPTKSCKVMKSVLLIESFTLMLAFGVKFRSAFLEPCDSYVERFWGDSMFMTEGGDGRHLSEKLIH